MSITDLLKATRKAQGRSVRDVADAAGLHENTVRSAEQTGGVSIKTLAPWAGALGYALVLLPKDAEISSASETA